MKIWLMPQEALVDQFEKRILTVEYIKTLNSNQLFVDFAGQRLPEVCSRFSQKRIVKIRF